MDNLYHRKTKEKFKNDNMGFSLVELIIVIAIMAILAGALAPALIKYIRKARRTADVDAAKKIADTVQFALLDDRNPDIYRPSDGSPGAQSQYLVRFGWTYTNRMPTGDPSSWTFKERVFSELGAVPVSKTNKKYYWSVFIDNEFEPTGLESGASWSGTGNGGTSVVRITLSQYSGSSPNFNNGKVYELYPNPSEFLEMKD